MSCAEKTVAENGGLWDNSIGMSVAVFCFAAMFCFMPGIVSVALLYSVFHFFLINNQVLLNFGFSVDCACFSDYTSRKANHCLRGYRFCLTSSEGKPYSPTIS